MLDRLPRNVRKPLASQPFFIVGSSGMWGGVANQLKTINAFLVKLKIPERKAYGLGIRPEENVGALGEEEDRVARVPVLDQDGRCRLSPHLLVLLLLFIILFLLLLLSFLLLFCSSSSSVLLLLSLSPLSSSEPSCSGRRRRPRAVSTRAPRPSLETNPRHCFPTAPLLPPSRASPVEGLRCHRHS